MTPELKQKWVDALRSGEYKQEKGQLRYKNNGYCCLGVLYEVSGGEWDDDHQGTDCYLIKEIGVGGTLPGSIREKVGLNLEDQDKLIRMNDGGKSFSEIANWIEMFL